MAAVQLALLAGLLWVAPGDCSSSSSQVAVLLQATALAHRGSQLALEKQLHISSSSSRPMLLACHLQWQLTLQQQQQQRHLQLPMQTCLWSLQAQLPH